MVARVEGAAGVEGLEGQVGGQFAAAVEVFAQLVLQRVERVGEGRQEMGDLQVFARHERMVRGRRQWWQDTAR